MILKCKMSNTDIKYVYVHFKSQTKTIIFFN